MFNNIEKLILQHIPRYTCGNGGWIKFNAVCCNHRGERKDIKGRGNLNISSNGDIVYYCHNCKFKSGWKYGNRFIGDKFKTLLSWFGISDDEIIKLSFDSFNFFGTDSTSVEYKAKNKVDHIFNFNKKMLPIKSVPINEAIEKYHDNKNFQKVVQYLCSRGEKLSTLDNYYWTPIDDYGLNNRLIIPFYWNSNIVGYTGRYCGNDKNIKRYFSEVQANYIFNTETVKTDYKYVFVTEGPFDALSINGVAMLGDKCNEKQTAWLNYIKKTTNKKIVVIPDQEKNGGVLLQKAIENEWYVSIPPWPSECKDVADAVKRYGEIIALQGVIKHITNGEYSILSAVERNMNKVMKYEQI